MGNDYRDFDNISSITRIEGEIVNLTPIRVGTGGEPPLGSTVDTAVYTVNGKPCIPGSSLKGVFRTFSESLAKSMGEKVHDPWDKNAIEQESKNNDFCVICGIFGNTELASHVRIYDATPKNGEAKKFVKPGIGIDREFGGVKPGIGPFFEEFVIPNTVWDFRMDVINIDLIHPNEEDKRSKLLRELLKHFMNEGLSVGARKSIGCGLMKLRDARFKLYSFEDGRLTLKQEGVLDEL